MVAYKVFRQYGGGLQTIFGRTGDPLYKMGVEYTTDRSPAFHAYVYQHDAEEMRPVLGGVVFRVELGPFESAVLEDGKVVVTSRSMKIKEMIETA